MIVVLKSEATEAQIQHILDKVQKLGLKPHISRGVEKTIIGLIGPEDALQVTPLEIYPGVEKVIPVLSPYRLVSREFKKENSVIRVNDRIAFGDKQVPVIAGPCSIESLEGLRRIAGQVKAAGATALRGGAFKPRTSPYDFQGLGEEGLKYMQAVGKEFGLATVTEVMDTRDVELIGSYVDMFQIGARNMQNFSLLREVGKTHKPVILKRGISATIKEWLMSAEYVLSTGNFNVILCERGIRTFETETRNTLDINAIAVAKQKSHLPVMADPSHATGRWGIVGAAARAALAAGGDGLMIEVHDNPQEAFSDGEQSLLPGNFAGLMRELRRVAEAVDRRI
ncbi:MAG: 3-deoxy-7-phosphoheptulonate synthase [Candidatus Omnitrophica bacterium]|nr:3-deoxy-7-phosphoheptulonate synthase [Candidatus Omnitrophota bacterium]